MDSVWGKIVVGLAGFGIAGPLGAVAGILAGHALDRMRETGLLDRLLPLEDDPRRPASLTFSAAALAAKTARADGPVNAAEMRAFRGLLHLRPRHERPALLLRFSLAAETAEGFEPHAEALAETFAEAPALRFDVLQMLFSLAIADGPANRAELEFLRAVAETLGLGAAAVERLREDAVAEGHSDPYLVLQVPPTASDSEIKAAYRRLIRRHHPDGMAARSPSEAELAEATRRMAAINAAYDTLRRRRGA